MEIVREVQYCERKPEGGWKLITVRIHTPGQFGRLHRSLKRRALKAEVIYPVNQSSGDHQ